MPRDTWNEQYDAAAAKARTLAQRKADAPLRPTVAQQPRHELGGLFGDSHTQLDLIDAIRSKS